MPARCCSRTHAAFLPEEAVVLAVVDPSVGSDRDIAIETERGRLLVGPDNGLLAFLWHADGGVRRVHAITLDRSCCSRSRRRSMRETCSLRQQGSSRPAARSRSSGEQLDAASLAEFAFPAATVAAGKIECEVLDLNRFGNVLLNVTADDFAAAGLDHVDGVAIDATSGAAQARRSSTYTDVEEGNWGLIVDPRGWLSVIRGNPANAAEGLGGVQPGDPIWLTVPRVATRSATKVR